MQRAITRSAVVPAAAADVFDLLADPRRHPEIDGSGTLRASLAAPPRLTRGAKFGMRMRMGLPYVISNTVVEFEEGHRIAWRHLGRHIWRYELEPLTVDGAEHTTVTETFDYGTSPAARLLEMLQVPQRNARSIEATLTRLQERFGSG